MSDERRATRDGRRATGDARCGEPRDAGGSGASQSGSDLSDTAASPHVSRQSIQPPLELIDRFGSGCPLVVGPEPEIASDRDLKSELTGRTVRHVDVTQELT